MPKRWKEVNIDEAQNSFQIEEEHDPLSVLLLDDMFVVAAAFEVSRLN
jgi:hypothetical protein